MAERTRPTKRQLEITLAKLRILETPNLRLEQYPVSSEAAAELLYMAGFEHRDLEGRIIDLGTGTGRLAIGASLMGTACSVGVDVDAGALELAQLNAEQVGARVEWIESDIEKIEGAYDAVIMNPPYGTRTIHADRRFLEKAFRLAPVVYSIHKSSTRRYVGEFATNARRKVDEIRSVNMKIPHLFPFHNRKWEVVEVDLCRIVT